MLRFWRPLLVLVLIGVGIGTLIWCERRQAKMDTEAKLIPAIVETRFDSPNVQEAVEVQSTVYLTFESLAREAKKATRTLVVYRPVSTAVGRNQPEIWAFLEAQGYTTLRGAIISQAPRETSIGVYTLSGYKVSSDHITMTWKLNYIRVYILFGLAVLLICVLGVTILVH